MADDDPGKILSSLIGREASDTKRLWIDGDTSVLGERAVIVGNAVKAALANVGKLMWSGVSDEGKQFLSREASDTKRLWIDGDTSVLGERAVIVGNAVKTALTNVVTGGHAADGISGGIVPGAQGPDQKHR
jgi:hypothetical protein